MALSTSVMATLEIQLAVLLGSASIGSQWPRWLRSSSSPWPA